PSAETSESRHSLPPPFAGLEQIIKVGDVYSQHRWNGTAFAGPKSRSGVERPEGNDTFAHHMRHRVCGALHTFISLRHGVPASEELREAPRGYLIGRNTQVMSPESLAEALNRLRVIEHQIQLGVKEEASRVGIGRANREGFVIHKDKLRVEDS